MSRAMSSSYYSSLVSFARRSPVECLVRYLASVVCLAFTEQLIFAIYRVSLLST